MAGKHIIAMYSQSRPSGAREQRHNQRARNSAAEFHSKPYLPPNVGQPGIFGNPGMLLGKPVGKLGIVGMSAGKLGKVGVPFPLVGSPAGVPVGRPEMLGNKVGMVPSVGSPGMLGKPVGKLGMTVIPWPLFGSPGLTGAPVGSPGMCGNQVGKVSRVGCPAADGDGVGGGEGVVLGVGVADVV